MFRTCARGRIQLRGLLSVIPIVVCLALFFILWGLNVFQHPPDHIVLLEEQYYGYGDYHTLIEQHFYFKKMSSICEIDNTTEILIHVFSRPVNKNLRNAVRKTWGKQDKYIKVVFILGAQYPHNETIDDEINKEAAEYQDIVQGNFFDIDENLAYKHMTMFKYTVYHCRNIKYILKVDDNVIINIKFLKNYISKRVDDGLVTINTNTSFVMCNVVKHRPVLVAFRRSHSPHCAFECIIYPFYVVDLLYKNGQKENYNYILDNIYITGYIAKKYSNITFLDTKKHMLTNEHIDHIIEGNEISKMNSFIYTPGNLEEWKMKSFWRYMEKYYEILGKDPIFDF